MTWNHASRRGAWLTLAACALAMAAAACSASHANRTDDADGVETAPADPGTFEAHAGERSHLRLTGPIEQLQRGSLVELVPRGPWPADDASRPSQLLLEVTDIDRAAAQAVVVGQRDPRFDLTELQGRTTTQQGLAHSKSVTSVLSRDGQSIRLDARGPHGVSPGDYFFVLGEADSEPGRLGSHIVALAQVEQVAASGTTARVIHEMGAFDSGSLAVFAHHASLDAERPEALILFARTRPEGNRDSFSLPPLASAVFDYQAEFQFSNIRIETIDQYVDPAAYNAPEQAQELAPDEGFGVFVFGHERGDDFLYNITTYGTSPSLATSVGILPGGLPLPTPSGLEGLSSDLAPSFLATAMTQRGDHAETIYFLEYCLRTRDISGPVAFHLREHLALRYESIGRSIEGMWLMDHDIDVAREADNPYAELNALSIREYLHRSVYDYDDELDDLDAFLEAADDVLPDESLISERLERSRVLARLDRSEEALEQLDDVLRQAQSQQSLRFEVSANIARANIIFSQGDIEGAVTLITDTLSDARLLGDSYPRYCHALLAQYLAELERDDEALLNMQAALAYASTDEIAYSMASTYELAATLHYSFDNLPEAVNHMREAAQTYGQIDQFGDTARAMFQAGMLEMNAAVQTSDPRFLEDAYEHLSKAADTYLAVGDGRSAAQAYGGMGLVNSLLRHGTQATANYGRAIELATVYNDPETVATAYQRIAELQFSQQQIEQAQLALQAARLWATTFELLDLVNEIETLERSIRNEI